jgi:hypothetical protein
MWGRGHLLFCGVSAEREARLLDGALDRHVSTSVKDPNEWMPSHEEDVKDQHSQTEAIVIQGPHHTIEAPALQLRGREMGDAHLTEKAMAIGTDLKRVAIDQLGSRILRNDHVVLIHVADYVAVLMNRTEGAGDISSGEDEKRPISACEIELAMGW